MPRNALLIGVPLAGRANELRGVPNDMDAMATLLTVYGFDCVRCTGPSATRAGILACMGDLLASTRDDDAVVVYYSGHGGMVVNTEHVPDLKTTAREPPYHQFIVPEDFYEPDAQDFRGILDIELAYYLARFTERTRNVTVVLDCCHSGGLMRGRTLKALDPRSFRGREIDYNRRIAQRLNELAEQQERDGAPWPALHPDANPVAVRIEAARSDEGAYEGVVGGRRRGLLTAAIVQAVEQYRSRRATWDVIHDRVCTLVDRHSDEAQHPGIGGPRHRLLFQLEESAVPGGVGVTRDASGVYLRGGTLLGIQAGDRFRLMAAADSPAGEELGEATAVEVTPDETRLEIVLIKADEAKIDGARAVLLRRPGPGGGVDVRIDGAARVTLLRLIEDTGKLVLYPGDGEMLARVGEVPGVEGDPLVEIRDARDSLITVPIRPDATVVPVLERLQRAAITRALESGRGAHALAAPFEIHWRLSSGAASAQLRHRDNGTLEGAVEAPATVFEGDELLYEVVNPALAQKGKPTRLYVTILDIDVDGSVVLRTRAEPSGICIHAQEVHTPGYRAHGGFTPLRIAWPRAMPRATPGLRSLVFIVADRPHDLRALETCDIDAFTATRGLVLPDIATDRMDDMTRTTHESGPAASGMRYAVTRLDFEVIPRA